MIQILVLIASINLAVKIEASELTFVVRTACFHGDVQLTTLARQGEEGVVQICYKGDWRFVCKNSDWGTQEADVVCQQMGHGGAMVSTGSEEVCLEAMHVLRYFNCSGTVTSTLGCYYEPRIRCELETECDFYKRKVAIVLCSRANCTDWEIRLAGGSTSREGRVEVCVDGQWRAVCSNGWTQEQTDLLCSKLGHLSYGAEIRVFDPRRVPTLDCSITSLKEEGVLDLGCDNESDCNEDLGVQCLRNELLDEILGSVRSTTHVQAGSTTITVALGAVTGVLLVLLLGTVTALVVMCLKRRANRHSTIRTTPTGDPTSADYLTVANIATNPAYEAVKVDQREDSIYEN